MNSDITMVLRRELLRGLNFLPQHSSLHDKLVVFGKDTPIEMYDDLMEESIGKVTGLKLPLVSSMLADSPSEVVAAVLKRIKKYRDLLFVPSYNFLYIKLETGGFSSYDARIGKQGSKVYPILRIVIKYRDKIFDKFINPRGSESLISDSTKSYLERNLTLTNALKSDHGIAEVDAMIRDWLLDSGVPSNAPSMNIHVNTVSANTEFNNAFIFSNLPSLKYAAGPSPVDINLIIKSAESAGANVLPMVLYSSNPIKYVDVMAEVHSDFISSISAI